MKNYTSYDLIEWGKPFEKSQHALPEPTLSEVLIRVTAAGLCHSDLHLQKGYMDLGLRRAADTCRARRSVANDIWS